MNKQKIKSTSKLPRIIRMPTRYYKPIENSTKLNDDSGDSLPGPSKLEAVPMKMKKEDCIIPEKLKISHIPRRKSQREGSKENSVALNESCVSNVPQSNQVMPECRNVQTVNLLINPEFCPDDRDPPASVQATRPIPTLGQIYGHNMNMIDSDRLNDWFMELGSPINSIGSSNTRIMTSSAQNYCNTCSSSTEYPANSHQENLLKTSTIVIQGQDKKKKLSSESKSTNENIGVWLTRDVEQPTRDNESALKANNMQKLILKNSQQSKTLTLKKSQESQAKEGIALQTNNTQKLSLKNSQQSKIMTLKKSQESQTEEGMTMSTNHTYCVGLGMDATPTSSKPRVDVECCTGTSSILSRPTVVICGTPAPQQVEEGNFTSKSYVFVKPSRPSKIDADNNTFCSNAHQPAVTPVPRVPVHSYVDCLSEVLQKTTNFEVYQGIELTKPSNDAADNEIGDRTFIVDGTKDAMVECDADDSTTLDSILTNQSNTSDDTTLLKSDPTVTEWSCRYISDSNSEYTCRDNFGRKLRKRYYVDSRHDEMRERCKKCHRFKRFPSARYKLPRTFGTWRSGGSIRRLCYRRFNHVWKKTTERWAVWSTRSPAKSRKLRKMFVQNFVRWVMWEDVNVQTNILLYNETGTDSALTEHKSAAMSTMFNMGTFQAITNLTDSGSKFSKNPRHVNSGPSMFPFFHTRENASNIIKTDINLSGFQFPYCQQNHCTSFNNNFPWNNDTALGICKSTKSCQYEANIAEQVEQTTSLLEEMEVNLVDQPTDTDELPNYMTDEKTSTPAPAHALIQFSAHEIQTNKDISNMDVVSQNADTEGLPNFMTDEKTSTPAPAPTLVSSHYIQISKDVCNIDAVTQNADTNDLPNLMADEKTSTPAPAQAPILFSSHETQTIQYVCNMDAITVTQHPDTQDLPNCMTDEKTSTPLPALILPSSHEIQTSNGFCKMDSTLTQNADTADLPSFMTDEKTSTAAPAPILFSSHQIQTNKDVGNTDAVTQDVIMCQNADTQDLSNCMTDEKTSTPLLAPILFSTQKKQTYMETCNTQATTVAHNFIMCNNAEADLKFPIFGSNCNASNSSATMPSVSDIPYYRPVAGSDITHLINESRTHQAMYPILRKYYSHAASPNRAKDRLVTDSATQISPGDCIETVSLGVSISKSPLAEPTTSVPIDAINETAQTMSAVNAYLQRFNMATQVDEFLTTPLEETETQITPLTATSVISTGITPSQKEEEEVFMSQCILMTSEKENLAAQTLPSLPKLAFTGTKIMSISSKELSNVTPLSNTEDRSLGSDYIIASSSKAVGSNEAVQSVPNHETASSKCCCESDGASTISPCQNVSCGTDPAMTAFHNSRSTSARGLDSYCETEMILNNLIKKALIGSNVGSHHTYFSEKSQSRHNMIYVSTSTNTHVGLETKSIGQTASEMSKLIGMNKTDAEIQYIEQQQEKPVPAGDRDPIGSMCMLNQLNNDNEIPTQTEGFQQFEAIPHKSAAMMTSYYGLPAAIQVPAMSAMSVKKDSSRKKVAENLAQTSLVQTQQKSLELKIFRSCASKPVNSKADAQNSVHNQLMSLSRLIGKKRSDSNINSQTEEKWMSECSTDTSPPQTKFSNNYNYNATKAFESFMYSSEENQERKSCTFSMKTESHDLTPMPYELPAIALSKDSLADVLPMLKTTEIYNKKLETELALSPRMVDHVTSDNYVSKDVKESMLQACPEICDTGTESLLPACSKKSACVLTTQCVLPPPPLCSGGQLLKPNSCGCVFVYGEPRCVIHKDCVDAAVQQESSTHKEVNLKRECVTHSVGQLTSQCSLRDGQRNTSAMIRELLSPKVYKALYETTKLMVNKETKPSSRHSNVVVSRVDAEVDAAKFDLPKLRSASVLTSEVLMESKSRCHCRDSLKGSHAHFKRVVLAEKREESHGDSSLASHEENNEECCEACTKRYLVTSCRYYSGLLTKQLDRVRQNLTKHLGAPSMEKMEQPISNIEACTMKPSGRKAFATQTLKYNPYYPSRHMSCMLSPATSLTNICKYDKAHLKSVYYMLSAIEGRLRRMKLNSQSLYCQ